MHDWDDDLAVPFPLEFTIQATPRSLQASKSARETWKSMVGEAARNRIAASREFTFLDERPLSVTIFYFPPAPMQGDVDNTSGAAVMLEAMRILKAVGATPRRTIRIAMWGGEEQGLHGSREYVLKHFGDPAKGVTPDYDRLQAYFNQDYGPGQYRGIYLQGNERARRLMTVWTEPFRDLGMSAVSILGVGSTDHISFDRVGLPGFQFLQDRVGGTGGHTNLDFVDTLPPDDLMKNAVIVASFAWHAAMTDERVPRKGGR